MSILAISFHVHAALKYFRAGKITILCMCVCVRACVRVCVRACVCSCVCSFLGMRVFVLGHACVRSCVCVCSCVCVPLISFFLSGQVALSFVHDKAQPESTPCWIILDIVPRHNDVTGK